jgi:transcriptional regulator with XRE-family HTH domain
MKKETQIAQGERLKMLRKQFLNKTQIQLGTFVDASSRSINRYENGETAIPEIFYTMLEIAFPKINIDWIKRGVGLMYKDNLEEVSLLEEPGVTYNSENLDCEKKLSLAQSEIISLRAQLAHTKLLLQAARNQ